jgi:hypothetical protein
MLAGRGGDLVDLSAYCASKRAAPNRNPAGDGGRRKDDGCDGHAADFKAPWLPSRESGMTAL